MTIALFKVLHIISFVLWIFGLFALVFLSTKRSHEQVVTWKSQLYRKIATPFMVATFVFGIAMLGVKPIYMKAGWMHVKLLFLLFFAGYHFYLKKLVKSDAGEKVSLHYYILGGLIAVIAFLAVFGEARLIFNG